MECSFGSVVETIKHARKKKGATLFIGSGCSDTAGIPTSEGIIKRIKQDFPGKAKRAESEHYSSYMKVLEEDFRNDLIVEYIKNAGLNWAHICIAQLIKEGYVTRVLTTNFDPLVIRACALVNKYPAVYDIPSMAKFDLERIADLSVHYLHGQHTGMTLVHTAADDEPIRGIIDSLIKDSISKKPIIIVGYSGDSDPVFKSLCRIKKFKSGLYWICYKDKLPRLEVMSGLFNEDKGANYCLNYDADSFFIKLSRELGIFPPQIMKRPFSHLLEIFESITDFPLEKDNTPIPLTAYYKRIIKDADEKYGDLDQIEESNNPNVIVMKMAYLFASERYEDIIALDSTVIGKLNIKQKNLLIWSYITLGNRLADQAENKKDKERDRLYREAYEKYEKAIEIRPDMPEAYNNWAIALTIRAGSSKGEESDQLYREAYEKYGKAVENKSDWHEAYCAWGIALTMQAGGKSEEEADRLYREACKKYRKAVELKSNFYDAYFNWGNALSDQAKCKQEEDADRLYRESYEKYGKAVEIKPDKHEAYNRWGNALLIQAKSKKGDEAIRLLQEAFEKLIKAKEKGFYDLACIESLRGNPAECRKWLLKAKEAGTLPGKNHLMNDTDLDNVRDQDWFKEFMASLQS